MSLDDESGDGGDDGMWCNLPYRDPDYLRAAYHVRRQSLSAIAHVFGVTDVTILRWMERHGIPRRGRGSHETSPPDSELLRDVQRVEAEVGRFPTTIDYKQRGEYSTGLILSRFDGDWDSIVERARESVTGGGPDDGT